jgi:Do/DeqQ family serine protease
MNCRRRKLTAWAFLVAGVLIVLSTGTAEAQKRVPSSRTEINLSYAPLVKKAAPAVVNIFTKKTVRALSFSPLFDDPFFRRFFGDNFRVGPPSRKKVQNSLGSGVIVDPKGIIITNHHVIAGADEIRVVLSDRREFDAKIIGSDERTDLAIIQVDTNGSDLPHLKFRDSDELEVGDLVLAIGNPFGFGQTVTSGIVSALARTQVGINDFNFFIQTDAAINPGNSGGALISLDGRLVGVNSAIYSKGGGSVGIGFAIPSNMVRSVLSGISKAGRLVRPWIGAEGQGITAAIAENLGLRRPAGVLISDVFPKGPADRAGVRVGDVIVSINGHEVDDPEALKFRIATRPIGDTVKLDLVRRGRGRSVDFSIEAPPRDPKPSRTELSGVHPVQGATVANLSPALADEMGVNLLKTGVIVAEVRRGSASNRFGFRLGDIVRKINGTEIKSVAQLKALLVQKVSRWRVVIERDGESLSMVVDR